MNFFKYTPRNVYGASIRKCHQGSTMIAVENENRTTGVVLDEIEIEAELL
jgi:hypothetical protein